MQKNFPYAHVACCIFALTALVSCKKNYEDAVNNGNPQMSTFSSTTIPIAADSMPTVLGDTFSNPFRIANIRAVKDSLDDAGVNSLRPFNVRTTHYYMKFNPTNEAQLDELHADTSLFYFDYPQNREILVQGNFYVEPGLADGVPTPQYVVMPVGKAFNTTISHTILDSLYLPEEDTTLLGPELNQNFRYTQILIDESNKRGGTDLLIVTGPFLDEEGYGPGGSGGVAIRRRTEGRIRVFDNRIGQYIGLEGVEVSATVGGTTKRAFTNANGDYSLDASQFFNNATCRIHFRRSGNFKVFNSSDLIDAQIVRSNINGSVWNHDIENDRNGMHAHMFRAAYRYFYKNIDGLKRPTLPIYPSPTGQIVNALKLVSKNNTNNSGTNYIIFPNLLIGRKTSDGRIFDADEIFSTTIHEIAHTAHVLTMNNYIDYGNVSSQIQESWATAVEWLITQKEYKERGITNYAEWDYNPTLLLGYGISRPLFHGFQYWNLSLGSKYTNLFINLVDNYNELGQLIYLSTTGPINGVIPDEVTGYYLGNIQSNYLKHMYNSSSLFTQLNNNRPSGVSTYQLDMLLSNY